MAELDFKNAVDLENLDSLENPGTASVEEVNEIVDQYKVAELPEEGELNEEPEKIENPELPNEEKELPEEQPITFDASSVANFLDGKELIKEVPEGIDLENFDEEALVKTIEHNLDLNAKEFYDKGAEEERQRIASTFTPVVQKIASFNLNNPNASDEDILTYVGSLNNKNIIASLDADKDSETIVRNYYKVANWKEDEINEKVADLIESNTISKEAKRVLPKLKSEYDKVVAGQENQIKQIQEYEVQMQNTLKDKLSNLLSAGKIGDIPISKEDAAFAYKAIMNNDTKVPVKGKNLELGYTEALTRYHKYNDKGSIENLTLGILVMNNGIEFLKDYFSKQAKTVEVNKMVKEHRFSRSKKINSRAEELKEDESLAPRFSVK